MTCLILGFPEPVTVSFVRRWCELLGESEVVEVENIQNGTTWSVSFLDPVAAAQVELFSSQVTAFIVDENKSASAPSTPTENDLPGAVRELCAELKYDRKLRQQEGEKLKHMHRELVDVVRHHNGNQLISDLCAVMWRHMSVEREE